MQKATAQPLGSPYTSQINRSGGLHTPPRLLKEIFENGSEDELVAALRTLPDGRCDLREVDLSESGVQMLAGAVLRVKVDTLVLGQMTNPHHLLQVIPRSHVREWDFVAATISYERHFRGAFPGAEHISLLVYEVLPGLHADSCTQRILFSRYSLSSNERQLLDPFCLDGEHPHKSAPRGTILSVVLVNPNSVEQPQSLVQVNPSAASRHLTEREHAELLCQLMTAIQGGNANDTATLAKVLCSCSREQFDQLQGIALALTHLNKDARHAAQAILQLTFPVVMPAPQQHPTPVPHQATPSTTWARNPYEVALESGSSDTVRQAFELAPDGFVDLREVKIHRPASIKAMVAALETARIKSLALGFVDQTDAVLNSLPRSQATTVDLFFLSNYGIQQIANYKHSDESVQYFLNYLHAVSPALPRRELVLQPYQLTDAQRQLLTARFSMVETDFEFCGHNYGSVTFISQFIPPRDAPSPQTAPETHVPPRPETSLGVPGKRVASTQLQAQGASNFTTILGVLAKYINGGNSAQVHGLLSTADAPFNARQMATLKAIANPYTSDATDNVKQAAQVVMDLQ